MIAALVTSILVTLSPAPRHGLELTTEPARALVFVDGRFMGATSAAGPLRVVLPKGSCQIRVAEAGFSDGVYDITLQPGRIVQATVTLTPLSKRWVREETPIRLSVGQPVRGRVRPGQVIRYVITEPAAPHRMLVGLRGNLRYKVLDPDGREIRVEKIDRPTGTPGGVFHVYRGPKGGDYVLEVRGNPGPYSFRFVAGLPALVETDVPEHEGRRLPPPK